MHPDSKPRVVRRVTIAGEAPVSVDGRRSLLRRNFIKRSRIGIKIMSAANFLATDIVFVGIAATAVLAIAFSAAVRTAERLLVPWKGRG